MSDEKQVRRKMTFESAVRGVAREHRLYAPEAYFFVFEALESAQKMAMAKRTPEGPEFHVTGRELLEGIRDLAIKQFAFMAKTVFKTWGVNSTEDFGRIVFHLVDAQLMRKTETDTLDDFKNIYDFNAAFEADQLYTDDWKIGFKP